MKHIEIPNLPDDVYARIERTAQSRGVPVESVAAEVLTRAFSAEDAEAMLMEEIRIDRDAMAARGVWITDDDINAAKKWGRE